MNEARELSYFPAVHRCRVGEVPGWQSTLHCCRKPTNEGFRIRPPLTNPARVAMLLPPIRTIPSSIDPANESRATAARNAYTLIELLIVMAVLAAVAGLTLPAMRGPMDKSRLTGAAKQIQAAVAKSRSLAIREGAAVQFRYEIFGSRFVIERCPATVAGPIIVMSAAEGLSSTPSGLTVESTDGAGSTAENLADTSTLPTDTAMNAVLREGTLPTGVTFAPAVSSEQLAVGIDSPAASAGAVGAPDVSTVSVPLVQWSEPIRFEPSGRMQDQTIVLQGQRDFRVSVVLRGLTGTTSYTAPARAASIANIGLPADSGNATSSGVAP